MKPKAGARGESGYAMVAAVAAVTAFAYIAFETMASGRGGMAMVASRVEQTRLAADADAGIDMAIHGLGVQDDAERWAIDGRPRSETFDGVELTIVVEDERGKAPLASLNDSQARALFQGAGASDERLAALVAEFREWRNDDAVDSGPKPPDAPLDPPIRHGPFATVDELAALKDMDATLFARIAPVVTVFFEQGGPFDPTTAKPLAVATMNADSQASPDSVGRGDAFANEQPDEQIDHSDNSVIGRTLTIRVSARARDGARTHRMAIVELTGDTDHPYWVRYVE